MLTPTLCGQRLAPSKTAAKRAAWQCISGKPAQPLPRPLNLRKKAGIPSQPFPELLKAGCRNFSKQVAVKTPGCAQFLRAKWMGKGVVASICFYGPLSTYSLYAPHLYSVE